MLQSPVAVSLLLLCGLVYTEWRSRQRELNHERERDGWLRRLEHMASALEAIRDSLSKR